MGQRSGFAVSRGYVSGGRIARCPKYKHSTARQAAQTALEAGAGTLVLGHFSSRYEENDIFLNKPGPCFPTQNYVQRELCLPCQEHVYDLLLTFVL